jgi:hypothetical protein
VSDDIGERVARLEAESETIRRMFASHTAVEEARFAEIAEAVHELRDVFIGAKGAARVLGWAIAALAALASATLWSIQHVRLN